MTHPRVFIVSLSVALFAASLTEARQIQEACLSSARRGASQSLCTCIQSVADKTLSGSDQSLAARFFTDPQMAQDIRQSDRRRHEEFWKRYKVFGHNATRACG